MRLFVFNPEHDYALADGHSHFVAMQSAVQFAHDCTPFLKYISSREDAIFNLYRVENQEFVRNKLQNVDVTDLTEIIPWGWDAAVKQQLLFAGIPESLLPSEGQINELRILAHRKITIPALSYLYSNIHENVELLPSLPIECFDIEGIDKFVRENPNALFKAPYSGNGRGHLFAHHKCSPTVERSLLGVIKKHSSVMAEPIRNITKEFAMEFSVENGEVSFAGYSLFETHHYAYACNILAPDNVIESEIMEYVPKSLLMAVKTNLLNFITNDIAPFYNGNVGVDMYLYLENDKIKFQPVSEINLRMTMGAAANSVFKSLCHCDSRGTMSVLRFEKNGELLQYIRQQQSNNPPQFVDGKWISGFYPLNPITEFTKYAVCIR